jgi:hypothetical protein
MQVLIGPAVMQKHTHKTITDTLIRVAQDSAYSFDYIELIQFTAGLLDIHPFTVYSAIGSLNTVKQIANGTHPATKKTVEHD